MCKISEVAYIDILEGDNEGHIRFHTPEEAKAVCDVKVELQKEHSWKVEILTGVNVISLFLEMFFLIILGFLLKHTQGCEGLS